LTPLRNLPLERLELALTAISDLAPLEGAPLRFLNLRGCRNVKDVKRLASFLTLEEVVLPPEASPEPLRALPKLKRLSYRSTLGKESMYIPAQTTAEFWAEYDAQQAAGKK